MSYGGVYGGGYGGGGGPTFNLVSAASQSSTSVELVFDADLQLDATLYNTATYALDNGLTVVGITVNAPNKVTLITTAQVLGVTYTATVGPITDVLDRGLSNNVATFSGALVPDPVVPVDLSARTHCEGRRVDLFWTNPSGATFVKIVRRQKHPVFDLTDPHDVVYAGPAISSFQDSGIVYPQLTLTADVASGVPVIPTSVTTGITSGNKVRIERLTGTPSYEILTVLAVMANQIIVSPAPSSAYPMASSRVSKSAELVDQTFYYYTVLVTTDVVMPADHDWDINDNSSVAGLSIQQIDSREGFMWKNTPREHRRLDNLPVSEGGGGGFLDKWYSIAGCWLNLMRGWTLAIDRMGDDDEAPFNSLAAKNYSMGITPEGYSYDFEIPRRTVLSLVNVYHRRGTCEGIVRAVRMFTKWESRCIEFGTGIAGCGGGTKNLKTWDGTSQTVRVTGVVGILHAFSQPKFFGSIFPFPGVSAGQFDNGQIRGPMGDVACIETNTTASVTLNEATTFTTTNGLAGAATLYIPLTSTTLLQPNMTVQLTLADQSAGEIVEIASVIAGSGIIIKGLTGLKNSYPTGSLLSVEKSMIRLEVDGFGFWSTFGLGPVRYLTDSQASWYTNQWRGYHIYDWGTDQVLEIIANDQTRVYVSTATPPTGPFYAIAADYDPLGATFATRFPIVNFTLFNGEHTFLVEPTFDAQLKGTTADPWSPLWQGAGTTLLGIYAPGDIGVLVTSDVASTIGRTQSPPGSVGVLNLDPSTPAPSAGSLVGMFLNPNQNQTQLFRVISNTTTTVTVAADISSLMVPGQIYYVLNERNASRFQRLVARLGAPSKEFAHEDANVHILFG